MAVLERLVEHVVWVVVHFVLHCRLVARSGDFGELLAEVDALLVGYLGRLRARKREGMASAIRAEGGGARGEAGRETHGGQVGHLLGDVDKHGCQLVEAEGVVRAGVLVEHVAAIRPEVSEARRQVDRAQKRTESCRRALEP